MASTLERLLERRAEIAAGVAQPSVAAISPWSAEAQRAIAARLAAHRRGS